MAKWGGACVAGGMHGSGAFVAGGYAWQWAVCGRGHAWQGAYMAGGRAWQGPCVAGETATASGGTHPVGMHSCFTMLRDSMCTMFATLFTL